MHYQLVGIFGLFLTQQAWALTCYSCVGGMNTCGPAATTIPQTNATAANAACYSAVSMNGGSGIFYLGVLNLANATGEITQVLTGQNPSQLGPFLSGITPATTAAALSYSFCTTDRCNMGTISNAALTTALSNLNSSLPAAFTSIFSSFLPGSLSLNRLFCSGVQAIHPPAVLLASLVALLFAFSKL